MSKPFEVQEIVDPDDKATRCELLLALGGALGPAGEPKRVFEDVADQAFLLAESLSDGERAMEACRIALQAIARYAGAALRGSAVARRWAERTGRYAQDDRDRAVALALEGGLALNEKAWSRAHDLAWTAYGTAQASADDRALFESAATLIGSQTWRWEEFPEVVAIAHELVANPARGVSVELQARGMFLALRNFLRAGDRAAAEDAGQRIHLLADRTRDPRSQLLDAAMAGTWAVLQGDLQEAAIAIEHLPELGDQLGSRLAALQYASGRGLTVFDYLGREAEGSSLTAEASTESEAEFLTFWHTLRAAEEGDFQAAQALRNELQDLVATDPENLTALRLFQLLRAALVLRDPTTVARLLPLTSSMAVMPTLGENLQPVGRVLAEAAIFLGDHDQARSLYETSLNACEKIRFRPEIAGPGWQRSPAKVLIFGTLNPRSRPGSDRKSGGSGQRLWRRRVRTARTSSRGPFIVRSARS